MIGGAVRNGGPDTPERRLRLDMLRRVERMILIGWLLLAVVAGLAAFQLLTFGPHYEVLFLGVGFGIIAWHLRINYQIRRRLR